MQTLKITLKLSALCVWLTLNGCQALTVAPKPVEAHQIAFDGSEQNAGIVDAGPSGVTVTAGFISKMRALEAKYEKKPIVACEDVKASGHNYLIVYECSDYIAMLHKRDREETGP